MNIKNILMINLKIIPQNISPTVPQIMILYVLIYFYYEIIIWGTGGYLWGYAKNTIKNDTYIY